MIVQAYEDFKRYNEDKDINGKKNLVFRNGKIVWSTFESLCVGDIIRCENNFPFPADVLLLFSSRESNECSVTTVNLDGESNLKTFCGCIEPIQDEDLGPLINDHQYEVHCIDPVEDLHQFHGKMIERTRSTEGRILNEKNLLLRGSCLKNTDYIVGCVIYAGSDTKLSLNSQTKKLKLSSVDQRLHRFIIFYLGVQITLSIICGGIWNSMYFTNRFNQQHWYLPKIKIATWKSIEGFFAFYTLYNRLVPISIIFAVYIMKAFATFFFNSDLEMYDEETDQRARVNSIELLEELGQIEYLFCDKTGTLTENKMKFQRCAVEEKEYIDVEDNLFFFDNNRVIELSISHDLELMDLLLCLCICHTVKVSRDDGSPNINFTEGLDPHTLYYQASSPDELAFLTALKCYGLAYLGNMKDKHFISVFGKISTYFVREVLEFDSNRKCMSVIVDCPDGNTKIICKGAECSLFEMTDNAIKNNSFMKHLASFSEDGLRVLVVGQRIISKDELDRFYRELNRYRSSPTLIDRESEVYNMVEKKLTLVGVTGVEDKLQQGVPQTIKDLREAGIKIWIITGDKEETAVNISLSAGHISKDMLIHHLTNIESEEECIDKLNGLLSFMALSPNKDQKYALVIDGKSFSHFIKPVMVSQFSAMCTEMHATLCCRMNPLQKAQVVRMIKENVRPEPITAAIGDGGNDVSMILEAHVGIGIFGKEGRQAARVADYAIVKFSFLRRAIILHGQNLYINIAKLIDFYFYKSTLYVIPLFFYSLFCGFSMLNLYDSIAVVLYNISYNTLPTITFALFDKTLSDKDRLRKPHLYREIQGNMCMSYTGMVRSFILATVQATIMLFIVYSNFSSYCGLVNNRGLEESYLYFGSLIFYSLWIVSLVRLVLITHMIIWANIGIFIFNILFCFVIQFIYQVCVKDLEYALTIDTLKEPFSWFLIFIIVLICVTIDIIIKLMRDNRDVELFSRRRVSFQYSKTN